MTRYRSSFPWRDLPEVVEIRGDRGAGKTTMLADIVTWARARGTTVAAAHPPETQPPCPYGLLLDLLDALPAAPAAGGADGFAGAPWLRTSMLDGHCRDRTGRHLAAALRRELCASAPSGGLLVVLDDVQWADAASVRLLEHLVRHSADGRGPGGRVSLVVAHRPRQTPHVLLAALDQGVGAGRVVRAVPQPLPAEEALTLLPADLDWQESARILTQCRGNPGLLTACADALKQRGARSLAPPALSPEVLTGAVRDFHRLSETALHVAGAGTVLTEPFDVKLLRRVADVGDQFCDAMDELVRFDIFTMDTSLADLRFSTWLQRAAAHCVAGAGWLVGAQERAAAAGGSRPAAESRRPAAGALVEAAARRRWSNAPAAVVWSEAAAAVPEESSRSAVVCGSALALTGRFVRALELLGRPWPDRTLPDRVEAAQWHAWCEDMLGRPQAGAAVTTEYVARSRNLSDSYRAVLMGTRIASELRAGRRVSPDSVSESESLLGAVPSVTRGWLSALLAKAALGSAGPVPMGAAFHATSAALLLDEAGDEAVACHLDGLVWLAEAELQLDRVRAAGRHAGRGLKVSQERGFRAHAVVLAELLTRHGRAAGDADASAKYARVAESSAAETDSDHLLALAGRARAAASQGPDAGASAAGARREPLGMLSNREVEVAVLVSRGCTNQRIARALSISQKTVETHLGRIFRKLTVSSRAEVAALVGRSRGDRGDDEVPGVFGLDAARRRTA